MKAPLPWWRDFVPVALILAVTAANCIWLWLNVTDRTTASSLSWAVEFPWLALFSLAFGALALLVSMRSMRRNTERETLRLEALILSKDFGSLAKAMEKPPQVSDHSSDSPS